ncbi:hypothetical protein BOTBODRAFT_38728 [Botryobasidium botryosum FD-172 SS1]|uniref:threonine synthase n=1 Tax=Botryobasidium botryosum (strain FD-172 SS1) TaxID=930990 RepID=A0A067M7H2_BOTB1|nr:hypothetical protein BOTBODRAFT_38728 [Botryobasidium botryosum FD-172 SS1]
MKYFSTRGGDERLSFEEAVLTGLAPNGGLYIPLEIPSLPENWEALWADYTFQQLSHAILSLFISPDEISSKELQILIDRSYENFRHPEVTPVVPIGDKLHVLELWHGPTYAFKDVALQLLGNLFEFFLKRRNVGKVGKARDKLTVVGATSGDTGSAAIYGLRNKLDISIFILHPKGRVSPIQEAQMTTVTDPNVHNIAVKGTFDDCQDIVKALFADKEFNATHRLGAINSINWARILAQTVYYFSAYFHVKRQLPSPSAQIQFVVPSGNFGDALAGWYAKRMGLPMAQLGIATNANDILARFWQTGRYEKNDASSGPGSGGVKETLSPAMDILVSSNFERLLWYLAFESLQGDESAETKRLKACEVLKGWMDSVKIDGKAVVPTAVLELARKEFVADRASDSLTAETIKSYYTAKPPYIADPHTAVGLAVARVFAQYNEPNIHQVVLSTAHPAKFSEAVTMSLSGMGLDFDKEVLPEEFKGLLEKPRRVKDVEAAEVALVKHVIEKALEHDTEVQEAKAHSGKVSS